MTNKKHIAISIGASTVLIALLLLYAEHKDREPELLLSDDGTFEELEGPLVPEEQEVINADITNSMNPIARVTTSKGVFDIELFEDNMPITVGNFISLAEGGFYEGIKFHRVIDGFMIQAGDPNTREGDEATWGTGGSANVQDEFVSGELLTNTRGTIAMANTGQPNSGSSQFFINLVDNTGLDYDKQPLTSKHPVFGRITDGMSVIDAIGSVETKARDIPVEPVIIESIEIIRNATPVADNEDIATTSGESD